MCQVKFYLHEIWCFCDIIQRNAIMQIQQYNIIDLQVGLF